jgi:hypothetical protein
MRPSRFATPSQSRQPSGLARVSCDSTARAAEIRDDAARGRRAPA